MAEQLSEKNYRDFAQRAIKKYGEKDMLADMLVWGQIIKHYEAGLRKAWAEGASRARGADMDELSLDALLTGNPYRVAE